MKKLILILLLTGCTVTKPGTDERIRNIENKLTEFAMEVNASLNVLKEHNFPKAMKVSKENNNCPVDVKTNKCIQVTK